MIKKIAKNKKKSLRDYIDKIKWETMSTDFARKKYNPQDLSIRCYDPKDSKSEHAKYVRIRIGDDIAKKLEWKNGDCIVVLYDPDNIFSMLLVKSENSTGRKILVETHTKALYIQIRWPHKITLEKILSNVPDFEIHKQYLHFNIPQP